MMQYVEWRCRLERYQACFGPPQKKKMRRIKVRKRRRVEFGLGCDSRRLRGGGGE
jgi:hypothetical protein